MGLIQCPDCGKGVSEIAEQCPNCGRPIANITPSFSINGEQSNSTNIFSTDLKNIPSLLFIGLIAAIFFGIWSSSVASKETQVYSRDPRKAVEALPLQPVISKPLSAEKTALQAAMEFTATKSNLESELQKQAKITANSANGSECTKTIKKAYSLSVEPTIFPNGQVKLHISTNIPGAIEVMADLSLHGQADTDIWIGKNAKVQLNNGVGFAVFNTNDLPKGTYDAEVSFYPKWGFKDSISRSSGLSQVIETSKTVMLAGSGVSPAVVLSKKNGQKWVIENADMGKPWVPKEWVKKFGQYEEFILTSGNPNVLKVYYFPSIDITLIVNVLKNEITVWRTGKATSLF